MPTREPSPAPAAPPVGERLADLLTRQDTRLSRVLRQLSQVDRAVYAAVAATPTPDLDEPVRRLSRLADDSRIWLGIAAGIAAFGGSAGRRAAARGILTIGVTSAVVNLGIKQVSRRRRPDRDRAGVPADRHVEMPSSRSFPSGHSASGFAFAASVSQDLPALALPLRLLAGAVAYSRVHTGVHYPGDIVAGSIIGAGIAQTVSGLTVNRLTGRVLRAARPGTTTPLPGARPRQRRGCRGPGARGFRGPRADQAGTCCWTPGSGARCHTGFRRGR